MSGSEQPPPLFFVQLRLLAPRGHKLFCSAANCAAAADHLMLVGPEQSPPLFYEYQKWKDESLPNKKKLISTIKNDAKFQSAKDFPYKPFPTFI